MSLDGQLLGQRYKLLSIIERGGMGDVYLAEDTKIGNRKVAVKVAQNNVASHLDNKAAVRFKREVKAIANLRHPHILPLFDSGEEVMNGTLITYLVMPYCSEGSLETWLQQHRKSLPLSPQAVDSIVSQAAEALQYAHDDKNKDAVIHRDIKPSNFLVSGTSGGNPILLLADFGIAKFTAGTKITAVGTPIGTYLYMAPEQWEGQPTPASDQYSLAIMAYELLTGKPPFHGGMEQLLYQHSREQAQLPSSLSERNRPSPSEMVYW